MSVAWFVSAKEQVFGPYSHEHMRDYVAQKRIGQRSLVRLGEAGEFMPAGMHAALARCFEVEDVLPRHRVRWHRHDLKRNMQYGIR